MIKLRQMRGRLVGLSKLILSSALLLLVVVACEDDESGQNNVGTVLYIDGPSGVTPESTATFTASEAGGTISWTVTGNATLGATDGLTAEVTFGAVGTATVSASGSGLTGTRAITINGIEAMLVEDGGVTFSQPSVNNGGSETVTFTFAAPLASTPTLALSGDFADSATISSNLAQVAGSNMTKFIATITGEEGNGQLTGTVSGVTVSDVYGGATADLEVNLHKLDNTRPLGKFEIVDDVSVLDSLSAITFSVTLNEGARAVNDSMKLSLDYDAGSEGMDTLLLLSATDDPNVWSTTFVNTAGGDGSFSASLDQSTVIDLAGNLATWDPVTSVYFVTVDNTVPTAFALTATEDDIISRLMHINVTAEEFGSTVHWIWLPYNSQFVPESPADFEGEGEGDDKFIAERGFFKLFYLEVDAAGNYDTNEDGTAKVKRYPELTGDLVEGTEEAAIEIE